MSQTSGVYINGEFSEPMTAQHNFANQYDLDNPARAMSLYARVMHEHTKQQLNMATHGGSRHSDGHHSIVSPNGSISSVSPSE